MDYMWKEDVDPNWEAVNFGDDGSVGFIDHDDAIYFVTAWQNNGGIIGISNIKEFQEELLEWRRWWLSWYPKTPIPIYPVFSARTL